MQEQGPHDPPSAITERTSSRPMLGYAGPLTPRRTWLGRLIRNLRASGPLAPWPSFPTVVLLLGCVGASTWLARREQPWRLVRSDWVGQTYYASLGQQVQNVQSPRNDAVLSATPGGSVRVWRPPAGEVLRELQVPAAARAAPGARAFVWWVTASADGSKVLGRSNLGTFLWDARTGAVLAHVPTGPWLRAAPPGPVPLGHYTPATAPRAGPAPPPDPYLGEGIALPEYSFGALSPDGSRLCVFTDESELRVYDVSGTLARLLAKRRFDPPLPSNVTPDMASFFIRFSPDGERVVMVGNAMVWAGDAKTLRQRLSLTQMYCMDRDVAFVGADRLLMTSHGYGFGPRGVHLYDLASGELIRSWPTEHLQDLGALAVSPDGRRAFAAGTSTEVGGGVLVDLGGTDGGAAGVPAGGWLLEAAFFPDGRRLAVTNLWPWRDGDCPGVIDAVTRRHVSNLYPPPRTSVRRVVPFGDGRHVALVTRTGMMDLYEQVGGDSQWGLMATPQFWALGLCVALLVASLWRDALRSRRRWGRTDPLPRQRAALATGLVTAGGAALAVPFVWGTLDIDPMRLIAFAQLWFADTWIVYLFLLHLPAGLGLLTGSRAWAIFLVPLLAADMAMAVTVAATASQFAVEPERIFDRVWMLPPGLMAAVNVGWGLLAAGGLLCLLPLRRRQRESPADTGRAVPMAVPAPA
jgi:hypothetical protein